MRGLFTDADADSLIPDVVAADAQEWSRLSEDPQTWRPHLDAGSLVSATAAAVAEDISERE